MSVLRQKLLTDFYCTSSEKGGDSDSVFCESCEPGSAFDMVHIMDETQESTLLPVINERTRQSAMSQDGSSTSKAIRTVFLSGKENRKRRRSPMDDSKQLVLDAGQKIFGHQYCKKCGMIYDYNSSSDRRQHEKFHSRFLSTDWFRVQISQLKAWERSTFCTAGQYGGSYSYIFCVKQKSKCTLKNRIEKIILECVNSELGFTPDFAEVWTSDGRRQAWVYVTALESYYFIGAVIVVENLPKEQLYFSEGNVVIGENNEEYMGINRMWVHQRLRRKGIATCLLDHARVHFTGSGIVPRERLAFNSLTDSGLIFAKCYVPKGKVLLYNLNS